MDPLPFSALNDFLYCPRAETRAGRFAVRSHAVATGRRKSVQGLVARPPVETREQAQFLRDGLGGERLPVGPLACPNTFEVEGHCSEDVHALQAEVRAGGKEAL